MYCFKKSKAMFPRKSLRIVYEALEIIYGISLMKLFSYCCNISFSPPEDLIIIRFEEIIFLNYKSKYNRYMKIKGNFNKCQMH